MFHSYLFLIFTLNMSFDVSNYMLCSFFLFSPVWSSLATSLSALLFSTLIISLMFAIIPLCHHVILLSVAMGLGGKAMGVIDTIANLQLVKLYQKDSAIFLQVRYCLYCHCTLPYSVYTSTMDLRDVNVLAGFH